MTATKTAQKILQETFTRLILITKNSWCRSPKEDSMAAFVLNSIHRKHNTADKTDQKNITASLFVSFAKIQQS